MDCCDQIALIIPSLNPDEKLIRLLEGLRDEGFRRILLVNDGSSEDTLPLFEQAEQEFGCRLLVHPVNLGKGRALKDAFAWIRREWPDCAGAVTVDADGQHLPKDIRACAEMLCTHPGRLVLGCRDFSAEHIPPRSRYGNRLTRVVLRMLCGISVSDTQTGLRGIPLSLMPALEKLPGERFEFELNMLLEAQEKQIPLAEVPIDTVYIEENRTSHFHPLRDSLRIYAVFAKFLLSSLLSFLVDIGAFSLLVFLMERPLPGLYIPVATGAARVLSAGANFLLNKHGVFRDRGPNPAAVWKYLALCVIQAGLSALGVSLLFALTHWNETLIKLLVDTLLFLISFPIQREWVFKRKNK